MDNVTYEGRDLEVLADMPNYYSWITEIFRPYLRGKVIDYGAGSGTVSEYIAPFAEHLILVEPSTNLVRLLHKRFADDPKIEVVSENLETHIFRLAINSIDTVVMVNVLEHIADDGAALSRLFQILKPGGHLLLFVPALRALMSKLDVLHGHFRRYQKPELISKIRAAGGAVIICRYFDFSGVGPWFFLNRVLGSTRFNPTLVKINDKVFVPLSRLIEQTIEPPIGKNLIVVAKK
jgi:SAM-dependent methyltransferase